MKSTAQQSHEHSAVENAITIEPRKNRNQIQRLMANKEINDHIKRRLPGLLGCEETRSVGKEQRLTGIVSLVTAEQHSKFFAFASSVMHQGLQDENYTDWL